MAKDTFSFMDAEAKLPIEDTASEYYVYTDKNGKSTAILPQDLTDAQMKAFADSDEDYPTFSVYNGKVSVTGSGNYLDSDIVDSVSKTLQDYYKGANLANEQVAENFQKTLDEVNAQVKSQLQYQDYMDFLDKTGFSDDAYRNYSLAVQETDPKTTTNVRKSTKKFRGVKKDGSITAEDEAMTPEQWLDYWKKNYNPEERAQLWMDSAEALARASNGDGNDNDLYAALPYLIMGHSEGVNFPAGVINTLNPFDESGLDVSKDWENAKVSTPLYGFEDTNDLSVFTQAFIRQLGMRGLEIASDILTFDNPWSEFGATNGAQYFGIDDWKDSDLEKWAREDYQLYADFAHDLVEKGYDTYDKMKKYFGVDTLKEKLEDSGTDDENRKVLEDLLKDSEKQAKRYWIAYTFSKVDPRAVGGGRVLDTIRNEDGDVVAEEGDYPGYKTYQDFQSRLADWRENRGGFEQWKDENVDAMNKYVNQMAVYSPGFATAGIVGGQIASFVAEQAALSALTGGALSASNVAATLANAGWKLGANAINYTKIGQRIAAKVPALANALNAMATSTAATAAGLKQGYKIGKATLAASDATKAAQAIYTLGSIGNWAIREVGEDALRGLVDDAVMKNSFDSQGNLDVNKLIENVYMNAVMYGAAKGVGKALGGIGSLVNLAGTKSIDGVELNTTQRYQLNLFQKALDDQNSRIQFRGWNEDGHPVITTYGRTKILDQLAPSGETAKAVEDITGTAAPTVARTIENIINDENVPDDIKQKITEAVDESKIDTSDPKWKEDIQTRLQEKLSDDEIRQAFPDGTIKVGDDTIKVDTKEFTSGDVNRVSGKEFATMDDAIEGLRTARKTSDFARSINGILRQSIDFAKNFKNAVQDFAEANNMTVKDVMVEIRNSRLAGEETIPGLKDLWYENWKPIQDKLLDLQEQLTGIRPISHDFYFRDMLEGTFNPSASGAYSINNSSVIDMLGGDADFDLSASSTARNTGKLADIASDKLEYDPEVLAREFVASRMQTIWQSDDMGKIFATMQDAHEAGEYNFTEAQAAKSVGATERVSREVENSDGVKEIQNLANVSELGDEFAEVKVDPETSKKLKDAKTPEEIEAAERAIDEEELKQAAEVDKKTMVNAQKRFNESAKKSNAAELISKNSGYSMRGQRINPDYKPVGVNYMPGNPFGKWGSAVNDNYIKGNSIEMELTAYKADGTPFVRKITAYNGGYKMYAEAGSFARNVIVDVRNGASLWDAIYKQVYDNGFFIEPSNNQRVKYGALTIKEQAAKVTDKFMDKMLNDRRFAHVFNDDGTVKSTDGLMAMLTTRFRSQGISDFTKFLRKSNFDSFTKGEQKWLNSRMYEMTASVNKNTFKKIVNWLIQGSMALRYKSTMGWNLKNGQLQLTECQRTFTANKIGDFGSTLKRLATDKDFRANVSDRTYILAADSAGAGFSKQELDMIADTFTKLGSESVINEYGIVTNIDKIKAKYKDFNDSLLASPQGGEYAKNYIMIAGFTAAGERAGLSGAELDSYVRNRFNVEALAGTQLGKIGLTDSRIGQFTFMYLGFPIRELTLQAHLIKGGGTVGGKGFKKALGSLDYIAKMLGAKGAMWAMEAPWGYTLLDQIGIDPFGVIGQYDPIQTDWEDREPGWRWADLAMQYNPFLQGAMTSVVTDIYMVYRAAEEEARAEYREEHNGSTEGFEWSMFEDGAASLDGILKGLSPVGEQALGFVPGRTFYQRIEGELQDAQRGYHISQSGNRLYEANTDPGNILWGMIAGRRNTTNAQDYYQTANPIRGAIERGWGGLGQQMERGFGSLNPFRSFREFDPIDSDTYTDWFNGSYADQQNWNTGVYAFREEAQQIKDKYDKYISEGKEINSQNARENELADLRNRVEKFVKAYTDKHPEGISYSKQNQLINILNLGDYQSSLDEAVEEASGNVDYSDWDAAQNRYMQGNFPTPYGLRQTKEGENVYGQSPQLQQVLSQQRYGIASDVAPTIKQMYNSQKFETPLGDMTMKDYHDKVYAQLQDEWNKEKTDYDKVTKIQEEYLAQISKNVIQPILNTYGSSVLSAGKSSDIMQEFGKMLYSMVPSDDYRIDNKGKKIYKSTPYMTIDIPKWLNKNFKSYASNVNVTNRETKDRLASIRDSLDLGHTSTAISKARTLIDDIGKGKASVSREELEWLQGVIND